MDNHNQIDSLCCVAESTNNGTALTKLGLISCFVEKMRWNDGIKEMYLNAALYEIIT